MACAIIAFVALSCGMWLFTLVTPAFYWFGAPATFIVFYTAAHCACRAHCICFVHTYICFLLHGDFYAS